MARSKAYRKGIRSYDERFTTGDLIPSIVFDFAQQGMTQEQIGAICGVTKQRISQVFTGNDELQAAWLQGRAEMHRSLRQYQLRAAEGGDRTALVWLGKNELGQRDSIKEVEAHVDTQITYIAIWGGQHGGALPARLEKQLEAGIPEEDIIDGEVLEDIIDLTGEEEEDDDD
jgi:transcriptional regulator with XRE-family HTH domain